MKWLLSYKSISSTCKTNDLFYDVPNNFWATDAVRSLYSNGITKGIGDYKYGGEMNVTREQFATFMYKAINVSPYFIPDSIPAKDENKYKEIENILIDSGFLKPIITMYILKLVEHMMALCILIFLPMMTVHIECLFIVMILY